MIALPLHSVRLDFTRSARLEEELERRLAKEAAHKRRVEEEKASKEKEDRLEEIVAAVLASPDEIAAFELKLDTYDAATVEALLENERALDLVQERLDDMLLRAHRLPDGRTVFKTEDGSRVFDISGAELSPEEIMPEEISSQAPTWEQWTTALQEKHQLTEERTELLEFQDKLDTARERLDEGTLTADELHGMDAELSELMPERVRKLVEPQNEPEDPKPQDELRQHVAPTREAAFAAPQPF